MILQPPLVQPVTSLSASRLREIDGLRALAFSLVFAFHTWEFAGRPQLGVLTAVIAQNTRPDFFVVLTGFVLMLPFARDLSRLSSFAWRPYLRRRLRRIVFPYYAALLFAAGLPQLLVAVVRILGRPANWQRWPSLEDWAWHISFLHTFSTEHWAGINGSLWTMSLEMQLYLLFPLLVILIRSWGFAALVGALALSLLYRVAAALAIRDSGSPVEFLVCANALGRLPEFLAGIVCAWAVFRWGPGVGAHLWAKFLTCVVVGYAVAVSTVVPMRYFALRELGLGLAFAALIGLVTLTPALRATFGSPVVSWIGYRAYSFFLIHQPLMWFFAEFVTKLLAIPNGPPKLAILWTAGLAVTCVVGEAFFRLVELPCIRWAKRVPSGGAACGRIGQGV